MKRKEDRCKRRLPMVFSIHLFLFFNDRKCICRGRERERRRKGILTDWKEDLWPLFSHHVYNRLIEEASRREKKEKEWDWVREREWKSFPGEKKTMEIEINRDKCKYLSQWIHLLLFHTFFIPLSSIRYFFFISMKIWNWPPFCYCYTCFPQWISKIETE